MATYWSTAFPFDFDNGGNKHYYVPFSVKFKKNISTDWYAVIKVQYLPPLWGDTFAHAYGVRCNDANANVSCITAYKLEEGSETYHFTVTFITASDTATSVSYANGSQGSNGSEIGYWRPTTKTLDYQYTYKGKKVYYNVWTVNWSVPSTDGSTTISSTIFDGEGTQKMSDSQYAALADAAYYFAWLTLYDSAYTNDPYNRPPKGDEEGDEPRGGQGTWDNHSDVIPVDPIPTGAWGQGFISVYNPTNAELRGFATQLWREDLRNTWKDLFPNGGVTSGIISCITIPVQPDTSGSSQICVGGVAIASTSANVLANRFKVVDFGIAPIKYTKEHFGGFQDYLCTKIGIYLPYIGWEELSPEMVINCQLGLQYKIDCFTGDFVAILTTYREDKFNYQGISYTFTGNCATQVPITSQSGGSSASMISAAISGITSVIGGIASGNLGTAITGGAQAVNSIVAESNKHSFSLAGGLTGSKGQLSYQRPYLCINRPVMEDGVKNNYFNLCGIPSNDYATIGSCSGFTKAYAVKLDSSAFNNASDEELNAIVELLKDGIFCTLK